MPTGPFQCCGRWRVYEHDGSTPRTGPSAHITIVKATRSYVKYTRKCQRFDPKGERLCHGRVYQPTLGVYRVSVGNFQHVESRVK